MDLILALATASKYPRRQPAGLPVVILLVFVCLSSGQLASAAVYLSQADFIAHNLSQDAKARSLWLQENQQDVAKQILGHRYRGLRIRYWQEASKTAWVLNEIGKDKAITIGVIIAAGRIEAVRILTYREPRGGEVRHPFFTRQYEGLSLDAANRLLGHIDGIAGATLSVRAVTNISRYALYLHRQIQKQ